MSWGGGRCLLIRRETELLKYLDLREVNRIPAHVRSGKREEIVRSWRRQLTFIPTNHVQCPVQSLCRWNRACIASFRIASSPSSASSPLELAIRSSASLSSDEWCLCTFKSETKLTANQCFTYYIQRERIWTRVKCSAATKMLVPLRVKVWMVDMWMFLLWWCFWYSSFDVWSMLLPCISVPIPFFSKGFWIQPIL